MGEVIVEPAFLNAYESNEGIAVALETRSPKQYVLLDENGAVRCHLPDVSRVDNSGVCQGLLAATDAGSKRCGYLDTNGEWTIEPMFRNAKAFDKHGATVGVPPDDAGRKERRINRKGEFIGDLFRQIKNFRTDRRFTGAYLTFRFETGVVVDCFGSRVGKSTFNHVGLEAEGLLPVEFLNEQIGWVDTNGEEVRRVEGTMIGAYFSDGLIPIKKNEKWGLVDRDGHFVLEPQFDVLDVVGFNRFQAGMISPSGQPEVRLINGAGETLGEGVFSLIGGFKEKVAVVWRPNADPTYGDDEERNFIDPNGNLLLPEWW
ncbi:MULTISPECIES: WG repeat-containing protein [Pirellulaceae]|nr:MULTISPECIES: WG repeat-containing protein [Pirellulaceae]